jgi:hypothetical protein
MLVKWGVLTKLICFLYSLCQEPKTRPSRAILVTRRTAWALKGESFDWQKFSQEPISGCSDTVGVRSWNFSYTVCSSRRRIRAASLDSGSWSLSWDAAVWINLSIPYAFMPSTPCWHKQHEDIREIKANMKLVSSYNRTPCLLMANTAANSLEVQKNWTD